MKTFLVALKPLLQMQFLKMFKKNDCTAMGSWMQVHNVADVVSLLMPLERRLSNTILAILMYAKTKLVSQVYQ